MDLYTITVILFIVFTTYGISYSFYLAKLLKESIALNKRLDAMTMFISTGTKKTMILNDDNVNLTIALKYGIYDEVTIIPISKNGYMDSADLEIVNVDYDESNVITFDIVATNDKTSEKVVMSYVYKINIDFIDVVHIAISSLELED